MKKILFYISLVAVVSSTFISCCKKEIDYLAMAETASNYDCIDSITSSWDYLQLANNDTKELVGLNIAQIVYHKADSLFDVYLQQLDLDRAARCLDIMGKVADFYGEMIVINMSDDEGGATSAPQNRQEELDRRKERLADAYYQQARSAEKLWKRHKDPKEKQRMEDSDAMAHKYNPDKY